MPLRPWLVCWSVTAMVFGMSAQASAAWKYLGWLEELSGPGPFTGNLWTAEIACLGTPPDSNELTLLQTRLEEALRLRATGTPIASGDPVGTLLNETARKSRRCNIDRSNALVAFVVEYGKWDDDPSRQQYVGETRLQSFQVIAYSPVERLLPWRWGATRRVGQPIPFTRAVEVGIGFGAYGLHGTTLRDRDIWRGTVPLRARFILSELIYGLLEAKGAQSELPEPGTAQFGLRRLLQSVQYRVGSDIVLGEIGPELFPAILEQTQVNERVWSYGVQFDLGMIVWGVGRR